MISWTPRCSPACSGAAGHSVSAAPGVGLVGDIGSLPAGQRRAEHGGDRPFDGEPGSPADLLGDAPAAEVLHRPRRRRLGSRPQVRDFRPAFDFSLTAEHSYRRGQPGCGPSRRVSGPALCGRGSNFPDPDRASGLAVSRLDAEVLTNIPHCACRPRAQRSSFPVTTLSIRMGCAEASSALSPGRPSRRSGGAVPLTSIAYGADAADGRPWWRRGPRQATGGTPQHSRPRRR
jgi:hypothetical protein